MNDIRNAELLLGNEAIAYGAVDSGVRLAACYPGTPSSEVLGTLKALRQEGAVCSPQTLDIEYSINEKTALEVACGAALAGYPAMAVMKHVGLNVAADPLLTAAYIGMPGGLVILSADDPGCHSSQNEQDNRHYARMAQLPCFEPASPQEAREMTKAAFTLARELEQPVLLRPTTRICHMRGPVFSTPCNPLPRAVFDLQPERFVPVPAVAKRRHKALLEQMARAEIIADESPFNKLDLHEGTRKGVIASGVSRAYLKDALAEHPEPLHILELGMTWPLPKEQLKKFFDNCDEILVLEEGPGLLENDVRSLAQNSGVKIFGKDDELTELGEYSTRMIRKRLDRWLNRHVPSHGPQPRHLPGRPPNLCPGCGHRSIYYAVRKVFGDEAKYSNDIGCYALGLLPPLSAADFMICMGSSITAASGYSRASGETVISYIGDSTFFHSGLTGLANAIYNKHDLLLIILDNGTTAMTGHQPNPAMHPEALGDSSIHLDIDAILAGLGISQRITVKAHNLKSVTEALLKLKEMKGVRVLHAKEPCLLFARRSLGKKLTHVAHVHTQTPEVGQCVAELGCPAFTAKNGQLAVAPELCGGCMLCLQIAPNGIGSKKVN